MQGACTRGSNCKYAHGDKACGEGREAEGELAGTGQVAASTLGVRAR